MFISNYCRNAYIYCYERYLNGNMKKGLFLFVVTVLSIGSLQSQPNKVVAGKSDNWHGFSRVHFTFNGRNAWIVHPSQPQTGNPWVWRAHFPDWHTDMDSILLTRGLHIVYVNTNDMYGSPEAMQVWDAFYEYLVTTKNFSRKVALEGVSRGGLYIYNWAKRNPLKVACIYAEAPVLDFKSWPGGKGAGPGSPEDWKGVLKSYGFTEEQAMMYSDNPIDHLEGLAACKVPILHAIGLNDKIVPPSENTFVLVKNYTALGGIATIYPMTRGEQNLEGHHFTIEHPEKLADFMEANAVIGKQPLAPAAYHTLRGTLQNSFLKFTKEKRGRVAFMGGSITEASGGWRDKVCHYLEERFPETQFEFINAGIASTGSTPGAFRLFDEVLNRGPIDLFFEEAAVNDRTNGFSPAAQVRGMEGIIRHALAANPFMDIVMMHFVDPDKMNDYRNHTEPSEIAMHNKVAVHYGVNTIELAKEVTDRIDAGEFTWKEDFKDLHPSPFGQEVYFQSIKSLLMEGYQNVDPTASPMAHKIPAPLDKFSYSNGVYVPVDKATMVKDWTLDPVWNPKDGLETRKQYVNRPALMAVNPGAVITLDFTGTAIGICIASGPDAGKIEYSIDRKPFKSLDLYTPWSSYLHLPWYLILNDELARKKHTLVVRISKDKNEKSKGHACRILHFLVNQ